MVDVKEIEGWILDGDVLPQHPEEGEEYIVETGVTKGKRYVCGYCEEGFYTKKEEAEKCCKDRGTI